MKFCRNGLKTPIILVVADSPRMIDEPPLEDTDSEDEAGYIMLEDTPSGELLNPGNLAASAFASAQRQNSSRCLRVLNYANGFQCSYLAPAFLVVAFSNSFSNTIMIQSSVPPMNCPYSKTACCPEAFFL